MKTKSLVTISLITTAFSLASPAEVQTLTQYQVQLQPGWNVLADPLRHGGNTLGEVLPAVPPGSLFYHWDASAQNYATSTFDPGFGGWDNPSLTLAPGEGGFLHNPDSSPFTVTFVGETVTPHLPLSLPNDQLVLVARQIPAPGTYEEITGLPPAEGAKLYRYDVVLQGDPSALSNWTDYTFSQGQWTPGTPSVGVGEPVFIQISIPWNHPPVIEPVAPIRIHQGEFVQDVIAASDLDGNHLTYSVNGGALQGVQINSTNGLLTWDSTAAAPGTYLLDVDVADDGLPVLHAHQTIPVVVAAPLRIQAITHGNGTVQVSWNSIPGRDYVVQGAVDLTSPRANWDYQGVMLAESESARWTGQADIGKRSVLYTAQATTPLTKRPLWKFRRDITMVSGLDLLRILVDLNRRKDYDYSQHGGFPGPDSEWLWERIEAIMDELKARGWTFPPGDFAIDGTGVRRAVR